MGLRLFLYVFFILFSGVSMAQSNFKTGYVVNHQGDTLKGEIDYKEWSRNPNQITFRPSTNLQSIQKLNCTSIISFGVEEHETYECASVYISMDEVHLTRLKDQVDTVRVLDTVFLKVLARGNNLTLYSYQDEIKNRFYIREKQAKFPLELVFKQYKRNSQVITSEVYKQQLMYLAKKYTTINTALERAILSSFYSQSDLTPIIDKINGVHQQHPQKDNKREVVKKQRSRFFVSTGLNRIKFTYGGEDHITYKGIGSTGFPVYKSVVTTQSLMPRFSTGIDWFANPSIQRLIFRGEIGVALFNSETSTTEHYYYPEENVAYQYKLTGLNLSAAPQVIYNIYNRENIKFYAGAGMSFSVLRFQENTMERNPENPSSGFYKKTYENYLKMRGSYLNILLRTGFMLNKKIELAAIWYSPASFTNYSGSTKTSLRAHSLQLSLGYMFARSK